MAGVKQVALVKLTGDLKSHTSLGGAKYVKGREYRIEDKATWTRMQHNPAFSVKVVDADSPEAKALPNSRPVK